MTERTEIARQRGVAARILRENRHEILRRWMEKLSLLAREKGIEDRLDDAVVQQDVREFADLLISWVEGKGSEADVASFYHLILDGRQYEMRLADIAYMLLELKSVGKQVIFENVPAELDAFRVSRLLDDTIEAVLRKSADLYELTTEADYHVAQQRLQDIFAAWDLDASLADAQTPGEVCSVCWEKLQSTWELLGSRWQLYEPSAGEQREFVEGKDLPVPLVEEQRQYLTEEEKEAGGQLSLVEAVRRRRKPYYCGDLRQDEQILEPEVLLEAGVRSLACQPLLARETVIGVLLLFAGEEGVLGRSQKARLDRMAGVAALALHRTARLELSHKRLSEAEVISRIGTSLLELPTREALLQGVAEALRDFRNYFDVSLFWVDREAGECVLVAEAGRERLYRPEGYRQEIGKGFIGICAESGQTIRAADLEEDQRRLIAFEEEYRVRTELTVPIKRGNEVVGVIHLLSEKEDDFPESEIAALEHVAPHIGVALLNARMIDQRARDRYEIEQAHRQLANIVRSTAVGITSVDTRGVYTHWSPSCEEMLGYTAEEVVGRKTPADFAEEPYDIQPMLEECLRKGRLTRERTWRRRDGTPRVIRETRVPLEEESGRHVGFTSYLVDVTEQKRAEEQLRRERDTLQLVVDAMGAGLALFDQDLKLQWANSALMEWFGLGPEDYGKSCHGVYLCGRESDDICPAMQAAAAGQPQTRIHEFIDERGQWHCYEQVFTPIDYGRTRLVVLSLDITEQRRQTEQMRLIGKLTEKVVTSLDLDRVLHLVLTCVTAGHAIGFNRAFIFLLDESSEHLEGRMAVGPVSAEDARRIWQGMEREQQTIDELAGSTEPSESDRRLADRVRSLQVPFREPNTLASTLRSGTAGHVGDARSDPQVGEEVRRVLQLEEFVCVPLAVQDEPLGVMLADNKYSGNPIYRYQVELLEMFSRQASLAIANARAYERIREQLAELRRTRDKLIEAERMASVGRMAGHLAHEIRNPLTTIGGFASSITRRHEEGSVTHRNAKIIYEEARRLERTLVNVLDYTRPLRPEKTMVSVNEIVRETVQQFQHQLEESSIKVEMDLQDDLPQIHADGEMVKQVVLNLLKNAVEAMEDQEEGGVLSLETARQGSHVALTVADHGPGMPEDVLENLFSPFFTTKIGGVGLGLSVSRRIVRQHGGELRAESELGSGSRFTVSLAIGDAQKEGVVSDDEDSSG